MPIKLLVVFILLALSTVFDIKSIADGDPLQGNAVYIRLALNLFMVIGLIRGMESARTIARVVGVLSLLGGILLLFTAGPLLALFGATMYVLIAMPLVYGGYLLWCMNQDDVKAWLYKRAYGRFSE